MKHYFSTLAAILSAVVIVLTVRSCAQYRDRQAEIEKLSRVVASATPSDSTPAPAFVRVTLDTQVYGREGETVTLKSGTRVRVLKANGPALLIEYQGKNYTIDAAITTPYT